MILKASGSLGGSVVLPPSKSVAHRMLICAALADRESHIECNQTNRDLEATARCITALGVSVTYRDGGYDVKPAKAVSHGAMLDCGESGSTLRFLLPVAAALGADALFTGSGRLPQRPLSPLYEEMTGHGVRMSEQGIMPMSCKGTLQAGTYTIDAGISSQFISGLLMALPLTGQDCHIKLTGHRESTPYIEMTLQILHLFSIEVESRTDGYFIPGGQRFHSPGLMKTESDWSAAAFWLVAGACGHSPVTCLGLDYEGSSQGDRKAVDVLRSMGAAIECSPGCVTARPSTLQACSVDCSDIPDLVPVMAVAAASASGTTRFENAGRLRLKESDRMSTTLALLKGAGIDAVIEGDTLLVTGGPARDTVCDPASDHRIAMSAAILAATRDITVTITDSTCTEKSYPAFFSDFRALGGDTIEIKE